MSQYSISGAQIIIWLNEKKFNTSQSLSFSVDTGETYIYGIDSAFAQEIATTKVSVTGNINGLRLRSSGGIQALNGKSPIADLMSSPYISIRIQDRVTQEDIIFIPRCKIGNESHSVSAKGTYKINFSFMGLLPLFALDRAAGASSNPASSLTSLLPGGVAGPDFGVGGLA